MKVLIYDTLPDEIDTTDYVLIDAKEKTAYCKGCFGCWLKTPGQCIMADKIKNTGSLIMQAECLVIISECCYGGYSPDIKRVIDRCIPGVLPFFVTKKNSVGKKEQHHSARYHNRMELKVCFYGEISDKEEALARELVNANGLNYWANNVSVNFVKSRDEVKI